jgi:hypothetical protein
MENYMLNSMINLNNKSVKTGLQMTSQYLSYPQAEIIEDNGIICFSLTQKEKMKKEKKI